MTRSTLVAFENTFHNTSARLRVPASMLISASQEKRLSKALCGFADCICGGLGGVRGGDNWLDYTSPDGGPYLVIKGGK